ncbi:MAG: hypothetical protein LBG23_02730, partial [Endomicrobium sp.]|nr:hypothetical protein [Endomicrobium sp.]
MSHKIPLTNSVGKIIGLLGISIDITDRKRAEELELRLEKIEQEKQKELYEIAKGVSHDICSPISALNAVKYMCADNLPEPGKKMFELSLESIKNISDRLIKQYRRMQKGESNSTEVEEPKIERQYIAVYNNIQEVIERQRY